MLQEPDGQELWDEHSAYEALTETAVPFPPLAGYDCADRGIVSPMASA